MNNSEKVCDANSNLNSPSEDLDGNLYLVTQNGEVLKSKDGHTIVDFFLMIRIIRIIRLIIKGLATTVE